MIGWAKLLLKGILWDFVLLIENAFSMPDCASCPGSIWILRYLRGAGYSERMGRMGTETGMIRGYRRSNERDEKLARKRGDRGDQAFFDLFLPRYLPEQSRTTRSGEKHGEFQQSLYAFLLLSLPPCSISAYFLQERTSSQRMASQIALTSSDTTISFRKCAPVLWLQILSDVKRLKER